MCSAASEVVSATGNRHSVTFAVLPNNNWLKDLGNYFEWPKVAGAMIKTVFTILPHFVLRYRTMRPDVARDALVATHGGLSLAWCATSCHISPMALSRGVCALG